MDDNGETREDLRVPEGDLGKDIEKKFNNGEQFMVSYCALDWQVPLLFIFSNVAFSCSQTINIYRFAIVTKWYLLLKFDSVSELPDSAQATVVFMQLLQLT